jgi:hypothetical protein
VAQWEGGGGGVGIRTANLVELARVLGVRPSELLGDASPADQLVLDDPDEIAFITLYRKLPKRLQDIHRQMLLLNTEAGQAPKLESHPPDHTRVVA